MEVWSNIILTTSESKSSYSPATYVYLPSCHLGKESKRIKQIRTTLQKQKFTIEISLEMATDKNIPKGAKFLLGGSAG